MTLERVTPKGLAPPVVQLRNEHLAAIEAGRVALFGDHKPADSLIGVAALAHPGCLIEVDAIAVTDD